MRVKAMAIKRLIGRSLLYRCHHPGYQHASMHSHALRNPSIQMHDISSVASQRNGHLYAKAWRFFLPAILMNGLQAVSRAAYTSNTCCEDDELAKTNHDHECEDHEVLGAATALHEFMQKNLDLQPSDAAAVVEGAPSFVLHLVAVTKQENESELELDAVTKNQFSNKVYTYLKSIGPNLLEPVLESIGAKDECLQDLLAKLSAENVQSIFSFIKLFEKLCVPRSTLGLMISEDLQVLSCTEDEIEAGFHFLRGLISSEIDMLSSIQRYPLILKAEAIRKISSIYDELEEFASRDSIIARAICKVPDHVQRYRKGCAKEVVEYLKSYTFTVFRLNQILEKHPRIILTEVETKLKQNVQFLEDLGMSNDVIYKVINRCPNVLLYSLESYLEPRLEYFKGLGFEEPEFCQLIYRSPNLFTVSLENKIKPAVEELRTLGLSDDGLKKVVLYRPGLFGYKLGGDISALVKQLNQSSYPEDSKVTAFIKLYSRGTSHKQKCEDCLVQHGLSISEAKEVVEREPGILGYNEHALNEKLESLKIFDIPIETLLTMPEYLSFALRKRVQRRVRVLSYMKSKGLLTGELTLKHLVLHCNTHFYNDLVKPHSEDKELCKIWYRERDTLSTASSSISSGAGLEVQVSAEA